MPPSEPVRPKTSTGPGPAPSSRRPLATAPDATSRARLAASNGSAPWARNAARAAEWVQPEPWVAPPGWRSPRISTTCSPSKKTFDQLLAVAARDDHRLWPELQNPARQLLLAGSLPQTGQLTGLGDIGGCNRTAGKKYLDERRLGLVVYERRSTLGHHHGVDNHGRKHDSEVGQPDRDRVDRLRRAEHADLHRIGPHVLGDRQHLVEDRLRRERLDPLDRARVLRRDRRDRGHPMYSATRKGLQVGLDAGTSTGIRAGDREGGWNAFRVHRVLQPRCRTVGSDSCAHTPRPSNS